MPVCNVSNWTVSSGAPCPQGQFASLTFFDALQCLNIWLKWNRQCYLHLDVSGIQFKVAWEGFAWEAFLFHPTAALRFRQEVTAQLDRFIYLHKWLSVYGKLVGKCTVAFWDASWGKTGWTKERFMESTNLTPLLKRVFHLIISTWICESSMLGKKFQTHILLNRGEWWWFTMVYSAKNHQPNKSKWVHDGYTIGFLVN